MRADIIKDFKFLTPFPEINKKIELELICREIEGDLYDPKNVQIVFAYKSGTGYAGQADAFSVGEERWLIRFSVPESGEYVGNISVLLNGCEIESKKLELNVSDGDNRRGILTVESVNKRHFVFENGEVFTAIGHNLAWGDKARPVEYFKKICEKLHKNGANWTRLWLSTEWFLNLFPKNAAPADFSASAAAAETLDAIMEIFEKYGIYVQLVLFNHGNVKEKTGPMTDRGWHDFSFNSATNGGYLNSPALFFTDERAKYDTKKYLRYVVSRWGYSTNILCYELFNEAGSAEADKGDIYNWHIEMAKYLRSTDTRGHMVTTSAANPVDPLIYDGVFDFINHHRYGNISNIYQIISDVAWCAKCYGKPVLLSECGASWTAESAVDKTVIHQHVWSGLMCGSAGTGCQWYWERIDALENASGYEDYCYAATFAKRIPWASNGHRFVTGDDIFLDAGKANALGYVNREYAYLWLYNPAYTFTYRSDSTVRNAELAIPLANGDYKVEWYDTETGEFSKPEICRTEKGALKLAVPAFCHDVALSIERVE